MGKLEATINTRDVILKQAVLIGSNGTKEDVAAVYDLLASGEVSPEVTVIGFEDIPDGPRGPAHARRHRASRRPDRRLTRVAPTRCRWSGTRWGQDGRRRT